MTTIENWQADVTAEKSLWEAFRAAQRLWATRFNFRLRAGLLVVACALAIFALVNVDQIPNKTLLAVLTWEASSIFSLSVGVLGFLIAGFSVFVTLSDRDVLVELAKTPYEKSGFSVFKYLFFSFLVVFVYYLGAAIAAFMIAAFSQATWDLQFLPITLKTVKSINVLTILLLSLIFFELMIRLKSFIWAVYSSFVSKLVAAEFLSEINSPKEGANPGVNP